MTTETIEAIARVAHEANRAYCGALGDDTQPAWDDAPQWQRLSAYNGVLAILDGSVTRAEQSHENWMEEKRSNGWTYGEVKDPDKKTHPCFVPFAELPEDQQRKDVLFFAIADALTRSAA